MQAIYLPDLLGRTESDPLVQSFIGCYHLEDYARSDVARKRYEQLHPESSYDEMQAHILQALGRTFVHYVLDATKFIVDLEMIVRAGLVPELQVKSIIVRKGFEGPLPFDLDWERDVSAFVVGRELGHDKFVSNGVTCRTKNFLINDLSVGCVYDEPLNQLSLLVLGRVNEGTLLRLQFHDGLKDQKRHLVLSVDQLVPQWQAKSPVVIWKKRLEGGDTIFTDVALQASADELNVFFGNVKNAVAKKSPTQLVSALKKTIKSFNKLTRRHQYFIETTEREELALYLQQVMRDVGLQFHEKFDVTEEWRDW